MTCFGVKTDSHLLFCYLHFLLFYYILNHCIKFDDSNLLLLSGDVQTNPGPAPQKSNHPDHYITLNKSLSFCHLNVRSITKQSDTGPRLDHLYNFACIDNSFDVIALSETHLSPDIDDDEIQLDGYSLFRLDRNRHGGGIAIYCRSDLNPRIMPSLIFENLEMLWIETKTDKHTVQFGVCYRPPNQTAHERDLFLDRLSVTFELLTKVTKSIFVLQGDFNDRCCVWADKHENSELNLDLFNLVNSYGLTQVINEPTRNESLLDLMITNCPGYIQSNGVGDQIHDLDHCPIFGHMKLTFPKKQSYQRTIFLYNDNNMQHLNDNLSQVPWSSILSNIEDIDELTETFTTILQDEIKTCIPSKTILIRPNDKPGMTGQVRSLFRKCHRLHKIAIRSKLTIDIANHKTARHVAKTEWKKAQKSYYDKLFKKLDTSDSKNKIYWKITKSMYGQNQSHSIPTIFDNGVAYTDDISKAEIFNNFFVSQFLNEPSDDFDFDVNQISVANNHPSLEAVTIYKDKIYDTLKSLKIDKACGPDGIGNNILKTCAQNLIEPLQLISQRSVNAGYFPSQWKKANVIPILKKMIKAHYPITDR